ncbi:MAG: hypothetical protein EOO41_01150, partial [Methanobacteriota archaeon]
MTPIIDYMLKHASKLERDWSPEVSGITSATGFVQALTEASIYLIPEAETDTTAAAEHDPEYYATNGGVVMPSPVVWIEYKAYHPKTGFAGWSAMLLVTMPTGDVRVICTSLMHDRQGPIALIKPLVAFDFPFDQLGSRERVLGKAVQLRSAYQTVPHQIAGCCNFMRELLAYINGWGVANEISGQPSSFDQRRVQAVLGAQAAFK